MPDLHMPIAPVHALVAQARRLRREAVVLVHDVGVYLMIPGYARPQGGPIIYAYGCNPECDADAADRSAAIVGTERFAEDLLTTDLAGILLQASRKHDALVIHAATEEYVISTGSMPRRPLTVRRVPCPQCHGSKTVMTGVCRTTCPVCRGSGKVPREVAAAIKRAEAMWCRCGNPSRQAIPYAEGTHPELRQKHVRCDDCGRVLRLV